MTCDCQNGPTVTNPPRLASGGAEGMATIGAGTSLIRGSNPARRSLAIVNETGAAIRIGYSQAVGEGLGLLLDAGATYVAETTAGLWAWSAAGGRVSYAEELDLPS